MSTSQRRALEIPEGGKGPKGGNFLGDWGGLSRFYFPEAPGKIRELLKTNSCFVINRCVKSKIIVCIDHLVFVVV